MRFKLPELKIFRVLASFKFIAALIVVFIIITLCYLGWFLYNNLYKTIAQTEEIIILRSEVSPYTVNVEKFTEVLGALDKKINPTKIVDWKNTRNPFGTPGSSPVKPVDVLVD